MQKGGKQIYFNRRKQDPQNEKPDGMREERVETEESRQIQCPYGTEFLVAGTYKHWDHVAISLKKL